MTKRDHTKKTLQDVQEMMLPIRKTSAIYSYLRLACVILAVILAIYADQTKKSAGFAIAAVCIVLFIVLVIKHGSIKKQLAYAQAKETVLQHLLARFDDTWKQEKCDVVAEKEDTVSIDLDVLGERSLYQYVSMAATPLGKDLLVALLKGEHDEAEEVLQRQHAIQELLRQEEVLLDIETSSALFHQDCMKMKREDFDFLIAYGKEKQTVFANWMYQVSAGMAILTIIMLGLGVVHVLPYGYGGILLLINMVLSILISGSSSKALAFTKNLERILKDYEIMFEAFVHADVKDDYLCDIQARMKEGLHGVKELVKVMNLLTLRHNIISYVMFGALCQLDMRCLKAMENWRSKYGSEIEVWLESAAQLEVLASLSVIGQVKETICFPTIDNKPSPTLTVTDAYHPLLHEDKAIANSISLQHGSVIITGSNMSGKTTFLRTLGVNMMLFRAGAPVCATHMQASLLRVYTSMRVRDDVSEGISTFYAEILRIRQMMEDSRKQEPMLVLVDEIFKGTNSADRVMCAKTAIARLHLPWVITLVSTHDFELCELEHDPSIQACNYHFSEYYQNDEIHFDYTLKHGRCTTTNAQQLMKLAGF